MHHFHFFQRKMQNLTINLHMGLDILQRLMQEEQSPAFNCEDSITLLSLFQKIPDYKHENFNKFSDQVRNQSRQIIFDLTFTKNGTEKKLFKRKNDINELLNHLEGNFRIQPYFSQFFNKNRQFNVERPLIEFLLNNIYKNDDARNSLIFKTFVGQLTITNEQTGNKIESLYHGRFTKQKEINHGQRGFVQGAVRFFGGWGIFASNEALYIAITKDSVIIMEKQLSNVTQSLPFANTISFSFPQFKDRQPTLKISIKFAQKQIYMEAPDVYSFVMLSYFAQKAVDKLSNNIYSSFAPNRDKSDIKHFTDGEGYFGSLFQDLQDAQKTVYIAGWRISPFFYLKRNPKANSTLQAVLKKLAKDKQVKIYIILFNAPYLIPSNPQGVVNIFRDNPNIKILLHPTTAVLSQNTFTLSHHQKLVVIDNRIAYMGGFDLAYGRYDNYLHRLSDTEEEYTWPGADYCNQRIIDNPHPQLHDKPVQKVSRFEVPRMPWHDIGVRLTGRCMKYLQIHFVQYWNHVASKKISKLILEETQMAQIENACIDDHEDNENEAKKMYQELFPQQLGPHPEHQEFIKEVQKAMKQQMEKYHIRSQINDTGNEEQNIGQLYVSEQALPQPQNYNECANLDDKQNEDIKTQIVRSASKWGLGLKSTEQSICNAYKDLIKNAKQYIYIENQFFMSKENGIAACIVEKIIKQVNLGREGFKVIVMIPALPGIAGTPKDTDDLLIMIDLTLETINGLYDYLSKTLNKKPEDVEKYIYFFSLRTHGKIKNNIKNRLVPVTEIVYIHSKLMIVDSKYAIVGSANINNRSMLGDRDSQLAVVVEDNTSSKSFTWQLIKKLIFEHFEITLQQENTFADEVWNKMKTRSTENHDIYKRIFGCYPDNSIRNIDSFNLPPHDEERYDEESANIIGRAIPYQRQFLKDNKTRPKSVFQAKYWAKWGIRDYIYT